MMQTDASYKTDGFWSEWTQCFWLKCEEYFEKKKSLIIVIIVKNSKHCITL